MASEIPPNKRRAKLNDGYEIPVIGLGTFLSAPNEFYGNEKEVGEALRILAKEPGFNREDVSLTSKAWNSHHGPENQVKALDQTLKDLGTDYLDLYLIHWPVNFKSMPDPNSRTGIALEPSENGTMLVDKTLRLAEVWSGFIALQKTGKVRSIGVSNFSTKHLDMVIDATGIIPAVNQVEAHPLLNQEKLLAYCTVKGIHMTAYMPFGGDASRGGARVLGNPAVERIAQKTGRSMGSVLVSWGARRGFSVLPKSVKPARIASNFEAFDLSEEDFAELTALGDIPVRFGGIPCTFNPAWPVNVFDTPAERDAGLLEPI